MSKMSRMFLVVAVVVAILVGNVQAQQKLKVATIENTPFLMAKNDSDGYEGFIVDLFEELSGVVDGGLEYEFVIPDDNRYGQLNATTGRWTGMVGMVQSRKADLVAADLTMTAKRLEALDFSKPFMSAQLTILTKREPPTSTSYGMFNFFRPYHSEVWLCFLLAYLLTCFVLFLVARITPVERLYKREADYTLPNCFWYVFSCFFRGSNITPFAVSTRLLAIGWWIFALTICATYLINLKSFIGASFRPTAFHIVTDPRELVANPKFHFGVVGHGATYGLLSRSKSKLHQEIFSRIESDGEESIFNSVDSGMKHLLDPSTKDFGFVAEGNSAEYLVGKNCELYTVGQLNDRAYALGFAKGSNLREKFSRAILELIESGGLQQLKEKWWQKDEDCIDDTPAMTVEGEGLCKEMAIQLRMQQMAWPFIFLILILILALFVSFSELVLHVWNSPKRQGEDAEPTGTVIARSLKIACCGCFGGGAAARPASASNPASSPGEAAASEAKKTSTASPPPPASNA